MAGVDDADTSQRHCRLIPLEPPGLNGRPCLVEDGPRARIRGTALDDVFVSAPARRGSRSAPTWQQAIGAGTEQWRARRGCFPASLGRLARGAADWVCAQEGQRVAGSVSTCAGATRFRPSSSHQVCRLPGTAKARAPGRRPSGSALALGPGMHHPPSREELRLGPASLTECARLPVILAIQEHLAVRSETKAAQRRTRARLPVRRQGSKQGDVRRHTIWP
jgi:hypothetical protein